MKDAFNKQILVKDNVVFSTKGVCSTSHLGFGTVEKVTDNYIIVLVTKSSSYAFRRGLETRVYYLDKKTEKYTFKTIMRREPNTPYRARLKKGKNIAVIPMNMVNV